MSNLPTFNYSPYPPQQAADRVQLRAIASRQRILCLCILAYLVAVAAQFYIRKDLVPFLGLAMIPVVLTGAVCVFLMAVRMYGVALGILMGVCTLVPLLGIAPLYVMNSRATQRLKANGIRVGLLGADPATI